MNINNNNFHLVTFDSDLFRRISENDLKYDNGSFI
jgi:hypothetical protein